jgi:hypothetical protein
MTDAHLYISKHRKENMLNGRFRLEYNTVSNLLAVAGRPARLLGLFCTSTVHLVKLCIVSCN